jgi:phage/plasmid-like protein (TIGR03299 family)
VIALPLAACSQRDGNQAEQGRMKMAHDLNQENGRFSIAYSGSRDDVWHRHGQEHMEGKSDADWMAAANLDFEVGQAPAQAVIDGNPTEAPGFFNYNKKTGAIYAHVSDRYKVFQPDDMRAFFAQFIGVDDRWSFDVMGKLGNGSKIWMAARFQPNLEIAGERHQARLLATTTFDTTGATIVKPVVTRPVCANTIAAGMAEGHGHISVRHNTRFDRTRVTKQVTDLTKSVERFKAMGDAMALAAMAEKEISDFFKQVLEIPFEAKSTDISARSMNAFNDLSRAYSQSVREGAPRQSAWAALQAVTRYVDHDRSTRRGSAGLATEDEARFASANFGSGDALKGKALAFLMPRIKDKVAVLA